MIKLFFFLGVSLLAAPNAPSGVYVLPVSCSELLPDTSPFSLFFEAVARSHASNDRRFSRRLFRILALRDRLNDPTLKAREQNPVDGLVRKTLCFYREQREPLKAVLVDDAAFIQFLRSSLSELETKVEAAVFDVEFERHQREEYERKLRGSHGVIENLKNEAEREAEREYNRLSQSARKKVRPK